MLVKGLSINAAHTKVKLYQNDQKVADATFNSKTGNYTATMTASIVGKHKITARVIDESETDPSKHKSYNSDEIMITVYGNTAQLDIDDNIDTDNDGIDDILEYARYGNLTKGTIVDHSDFNAEGELRLSTDNNSKPYSASTKAEPSR